MTRPENPDSTIVRNRIVEEWTNGGRMYRSVERSTTLIARIATADSVRMIDGTVERVDFKLAGLTLALQDYVLVQRAFGQLIIIGKPVPV